MASFSFKAAAPVVFVVVTVVVQLQAASLATKGLGGDEQRGFDYFILSLQWPGNSCKNLSSCCMDNGCCRGEYFPTQFTIHGLWPEYEDNGWPSCCTDATFDQNKIMAMIWNLYQYWPTYRCDKELSCNDRKTSFWAQQYEKHGTCGSPVFDDEYKYFQTALDLFFKHNINEALSSADIVASDTKQYPFPLVFKAVQSAVGGKFPEIRCTKEGIIKEIWLCFDKQLEPRHCDVSFLCPNLVSLPNIPKLEPGMVKVKGATPWMADA